MDAITENVTVITNLVEIRHLKTFSSPDRRYRKFLRKSNLNESKKSHILCISVQVYEIKQFMFTPSSIKLRTQLLRGGVQPL